MQPTDSKNVTSNLKDYINIQPQMLTIVPTHRCTAACEECCFRCTPKVDTIMEQHKIEKYINEAVEKFPSIKIVIITGGECFLLGNNLVSIIKHVTTHKRMTRVVTNGYWASSYEIAAKNLRH